MSDTVTARAGLSTTFTPVPDWVFDDPRLTDTGLRLFIVLSRAVFRSTDKGPVAIDRKGLAAWLGVKSLRTLDAAISVLVDIGALTVLHFTDGIGLDLPSEYAVNSDQAAHRPATNCTPSRPAETARTRRSTRGAADCTPARPGKTQRKPRSTRGAADCTPARPAETGESPAQPRVQSAAPLPCKNRKKKNDNDVGASSHMIQKQGADSPEVAAVIGRTALRNDARNRSEVGRLLAGGWQPDAIVAELAPAPHKDNPHAWAATVVRDLPDEPDAAPAVEHEPTTVDELVERAVAIFVMHSGGAESERFADDIRQGIDRCRDDYDWDTLVRLALEASVRAGQSVAGIDTGAEPHGYRP